MAERRLCSRREADEFISRGWVLVDGERVQVLGTKVFTGQTITLDPRARSAQARLATFLLNKPVGYVSGQPEKNYPPAVKLLKAENHFTEDRAPWKLSAGQLQGLAPAGRLDIDSTGLLVLTQDGRIARQLIGEDSLLEKEYLVRVVGKVTEEGLRRLRHGLELDGRPLKAARVERLNADQLQFILQEGKKRQIRRMCELVGLKATALKRVRIGRVRLGSLPLGQWRYLGEDEEF